MPESPESSNDIAEIRRELRRLSEKVDRVEGKVEKGNTTRLATLATSLHDGGASIELLMSDNGMPNSEIAKALGISETTLRKRLSRARQRRRKDGGRDG